MARPRIELDIVQIFRGPRVLTLRQLLARLTCSRATILRRLADQGYFSSYNYAGKFLTIEEVAEFDDRGLWLWKAARFSRHGTLKNTVEHFVQRSGGGMTHQELAGLLGVRVQNTVLDLVREGRICREQLGPTFVYLSGRAAQRREQVRRREAFLEEHRRPVPTSQQVIATLLELIKDPRAARKDVVLRCQRAGVSISPDVVDAIFEQYELDKKRAP